MKIAVIGLGAVGGLLAARLAGAGQTVSGLARGATLAAVREHGLRVIGGDGDGDGVQVVRLPVSDDPHALGPQDGVILAVKATALADAAALVGPLLGAGTWILPAMNGVPWWFMATGAGAAPDAQRLQSIDPDGRIERALPLERVLGGVVHLSAASPSPGVVRHGFGDRIVVGEPAGGASPRVDAVCQVLAAAGFGAEASTDVRQALWYKLWGNLTMNPVSALTGAASDRILDDPLLRDFMLRTMAEAAAIGARIGCPIAQSGSDRMAVTRQLGAFKTSMLQDTLAGRPLELDALVGAVREIGGRFGLATPNIDALLGLTRLMARERGLYPAAAQAPPRASTRGP